MTQPSSDRKMSIRLYSPVFSEGQVIDSLFGPRRAGGPEAESFGLVSMEAGHAAPPLSLLMTLLGETLFTLKGFKCGV